MVVAITRILVTRGTENIARATAWIQPVMEFDDLS